MKKTKKGLLLLAVGAVCGALCYRLIKVRTENTEDFDDFGDYNDGLMDEELPVDNVKASETEETKTDESVTTE